MKQSKKHAVLFLSLISAVVFFVSGASELSAQSDTRGKISDRNGKPLAGVSITAEGITGLKTLSDTAGEFLIRLPKTPAKLKFNLRYYQTSEQTALKDSFLYIVMEAQLHRPQAFSFGLAAGGARYRFNLNQNISGYNTLSYILMRSLEADVNFHIPVKEVFEQQLSFAYGALFNSGYEGLPDAKLKKFSGRASFTAVSNYLYALKPKLSFVAGTGAQLEYLGMLKSITAGLKLQSGLRFPVEDKTIGAYLFLDYTGGKIVSLPPLTGENFRFRFIGIKLEYGL